MVMFIYQVAFITNIAENLTNHITITYLKRMFFL